MRRTAVESTTMRSVGYDWAQQILEVEFTSGAVYQYLEVPAAVFDGLMHAESKGRYFNQETHLQGQSGPTFLSPYPP